MEKFGPIKVLAVGTVLIGAFLIGIPTVPVYYAGLAFAFLGGAGMGTQDTVCPVLLSMAFHDTYAGAMSAGQAFFGLAISLHRSSLELCCRENYHFIIPIIF